LRRSGSSTRPLVFGDGGDEGEQSGAAEELGDEDGGVALGLGGVDPLETRAQHAGLAAALAQHPATVAAHTLAYEPTTAVSEKKNGRVAPGNGDIIAPEEIITF
jgi:hypothetical protein